YGYMKSHMKTVKNGQTRTQERKSEQKPEAKSQKKSNLQSLQQLKHGLGYSNPYTLKQAISQCPKLYLASSLGNSEISLNVRDTEDTLDDASKSQQKVYEKINDPITVANKQNCWTIAYAQINALYKDFVPQKELSAEQKYFPSSFIPSDKNSNATPSILTSMPNNSLHAEIEQLKKKSIEIQEGLQARIKILEKDTSPSNKVESDSNKNVIAPGMYKVVTTHESQTNEAKHNLSSTRMNVAFSVRRPMNKYSHVKNNVLANSKKPAKKVAVYVRKNKQTDITYENVNSNKENVIDVDFANASKAKTLLCVSCMQNVVQIVLWIIDSGCSKHMTGDRSLLKNFIEKFMGTVRFGNDNFAANIGYDETPEIIKKFIAQAQLNYKAKVCKIRTDNGTEFKDAILKALYEKLGIMQQFSTARTPQQNGVVERHNRTFVEAARTMLIFSRLPEFLWAEAVATASMASEHDCLEPELQQFINHNSSAEEMNTPSKEDLDNLFGSMFEEYFETKSSDTPINSAEQPTQIHEASSYTSSN
ncbi:retrovirus-related pol polyprotein from transposon TNT 1-94, partial [Tanacetum coccineum]